MRRGQKMTLEQRKRCTGAQVGHRVSEATKKKISETRKKLGYKPSEEAIRNSHAKKYYGEKNPHWRGGTSITNEYECTRMPEHPRAHPNGYVYTHVLIAEQKIGRFLNDGEIVHHIDGNKRNNLPDNLMVLGSMSEHVRLHAQERKAFMNELNEKIARMIFEKVQPGGNWQPLNPDYKKTYLDLADSLIDVVKEGKNEPEKENQ